MIEKEKLKLIQQVFREWYDNLEIESNDYFLNSFIETIQKVRNEYLIHECYPKFNKIFRAFKEVSPANCKNVILGMDPYPNKYKNKPSACGLSFVTENGYINPSLRILLRTLNLETPKEFYNKVIIDHPSLMLNTILSIKAGKTNSHYDYWREFSEILITTISKKNRNLNWILLGKSAQAYKSHIVSGNIKFAPHPASYIYKKDNDPKELKLLFKELKWI